MDFSLASAMRFPVGSRGAALPRQAAVTLVLVAGLVAAVSGKGVDAVVRPGMVTMPPAAHGLAAIES